MNWKGKLTSITKSTLLWSSQVIFSLRLYVHKYVAQKIFSEWSFTSKKKKSGLPQAKLNTVHSNYGEKHLNRHDDLNSLAIGHAHLSTLFFLPINITSEVVSLIILSDQMTRALLYLSQTSRMRLKEENGLSSCPPPFSLSPQIVVDSTLR